MEMLAPQVAIAMENAALYEKLAREEKRLERDLEAARELQLSLLPPCCPEIPGLQIAAHYQPAREIGGDLYDFVVQPGGDGKPAEMILFTGDVSGKGAPAALYAAMVSGLLRSVAEQRMSPGEMLASINDQLLARQIESRFLTLLCAQVDVATRTLDMANAGLPHPILCRRGLLIPTRVEGVPLGLLPGMEYETHAVPLEPGDVIVFCSDGIIDNLNHAKEEFGTARLKELVCRSWQESAGEIVELIFEHAMAWSVGRTQYDDMTVMVLKALSEPPAVAGG